MHCNKLVICCTQLKAVPYDLSRATREMCPASRRNDSRAVSSWLLSVPNKVVLLVTLVQSVCVPAQSSEHVNMLTWDTNATFCSEVR